MLTAWIRRILPVLGVALILSGCASKANMAEILQQPKNAQVRTRYHLWYTDPENVSALNYKEGQFIPAGTVIEPGVIRRGYYDMFGEVSVVDGSIPFKTADGKEFTIRFDERLMMMSIEDFTRQLFTTATEQEIYKAVPAAELANVKAGKITRKMHRNSVLVVMGPPCRGRTTSMKNQSWLYWLNRDVVFRVIFKGDKVRQLGSLDKLN